MRNIYEVYATQIVVSESNPQGVLSNISGYPKFFDSRDYKATTDNPNGSEEIALYAAREEFNGEVKRLSMADAPTRVGWVVTLIRTADGREIDRKAVGGYPDMTPPPPPTEPNEPEQTEPEEPVDEPTV